LELVFITCTLAPFILATNTSPAILDTATERNKSVKLATKTQDCCDFQNVIFDFLFNEVNLFMSAYILSPWKTTIDRKIYWRTSFG
jgi:hypothetical protein